jgi:hypothetical protein
MLALDSRLPVKLLKVITLTRSAPSPAMFPSAVVFWRESFMLFDFYLFAYYHVYFIIMLFCHQFLLSLLFLFTPSSLFHFLLRICFVAHVLVVVSSSAQRWSVPSSSVVTTCTMFPSTTVMRSDTRTWPLTSRPALSVLTLVTKWLSVNAGTY